MTKEIIKFSEILIKDWLNQEYAPGHKNITRILSEPLLEELIRYNDKGNFDRVRALQCLMIYREQLYNTMVKYKEKEERKMPITNVQVYLVENAGKIKASATITFDDAFVVHGLRIIEGEKGLFVAMPTRYSRKKGRFLDTAHPISNKARSVLVDAILKAYREEVKKS